MSSRTSSSSVQHVPSNTRWSGIREGERGQGEEQGDAAVFDVVLVDLQVDGDRAGWSGGVFLDVEDLEGGVRGGEEEVVGGVEPRWPDISLGWMARRLMMLMVGIMRDVQGPSGRAMMDRLLA